MQQFTVPQFIDVEPKIIGPITARQFLIFLGAALLIFLFYKLLNFTAFVLAGVLILIIAIVFAFVKVNGRPFHFFLLNLLQTAKRPGLRVWNHKAFSLADEDEKDIEYEKVLVPEKYFAQGKVEELSLIVDTKGRYRGESK